MFYVKILIICKQFIRVQCFSACRVANALASMMEMILFFITLECTVVIAFNLYVLEMNSTVNMETIVSMFSLFILITFTFTHFYLSEWITVDLMSVADIFYNSPWYCMPPRLQIMMVMPIGKSQVEFRLKGLGIFECSLAVFKTVNFIFRFFFSKSMSYSGSSDMVFQIIQSAASYFLMIRKFG